jgi:4a-hydroxytetrahydrobiopterin dehydratase
MASVGAGATVRRLSAAAAGRLASFSPREAQAALAGASVTGSRWTVQGDGSPAAPTALHAEYKFKDFAQAWRWMSKIATAAEAANHHPEWSNVYNRVTVRLLTHDATPPGVTDKVRKGWGGWGAGWLVGRGWAFGRPVAIARNLLSNPLARAPTGRVHGGHHGASRRVGGRGPAAGRQAGLKPRNTAGAAGGAGGAGHVGNTVNSLHVTDGGG